MDSFHWILFGFCPPRSKVFVYDSLRATSDKSKYQDVVNMIALARNCLAAKYPGKFNEDLYFHYDFLVCVLAYSLHFLQYNTKISHNFVFAYVQCMTKPSGTNLCGYYICEFMHDASSLADRVDNICGRFDEKVRVHSTATIGSS